MHCTSCGEQISDKAEICPKCGVRQYRERNYCANCGAVVKPNQEMCVECGITINNIGTASSGSKLEPWIAGLITFLLTGLGQMLMGQGKKGALILILSMIAGAVTFGVSVLITTPLAIVDAYLIAKKKKAGTPVRDWEFF